MIFFFFQAEDGIRDLTVTGVQTCALPISDTRSVGVGGLVVVGVAVLLATTFLPAALAILGRNIDRPKWLPRPLARIPAPDGWGGWARTLWHPPPRATFGRGLCGPGPHFPPSPTLTSLPA